MPDRPRLIAIAWAAINLALCGVVVQARPFPWLAMLGFIGGPLVFIFMAERIAARLYRGLMERFASDWRKPQSAVPVMLVGWLGLAIQTIFLLFQL